MDNEKLYEDMKPKEKFEVLWAESGLADRPGAENLWQQMVALGVFEKPASIKHHLLISRCKILVGNTQTLELHRAGAG